MNSKFQIAFTSVAFNNTYDDVYKFESRAEQESFFEVNRLFQNAPYVNILLSDFINMTITYKLVGQTIFDLEKYNYCILRETITEDDVSSYKYYYYFINSMTYDSGNQFVIRLECDVIQTYYLGCIFMPCVINRAHLNRWKERVGNTVTFNNAPSSPMLIPDTSVSFSKYSTQRTRLVLPKRFARDPIIDWLNNNVEAWVYVYLYRSGLDSSQQWVNRTYNVLNQTGTNMTVTFDYVQYDDGSGNYRSQERYFSVLCYPIYRKGVTNRIACQYNDSLGGIYSYTTIDSFAEEAFNNLNMDTSFYISKQISRIPPFETFGVEGTDYEIASGNLIIKQDLATSTHIKTKLGCNFVSTKLNEHSGNVYTLSGLIYPTKLWTQIGLVPEDELIDIFPNTRDISDIVGAYFDPTLNPKLMSNAFMELTVSNEAGATFTYDIQKMDNNELKFIYSEYPAPSGASRGYVRLASAVDDYGVYKEPAQSNLTGLSYTQDLNLNYTNNQLANYFANNRNWQTQISMKIGQNALNQIMSMISDIGMAFAGGKASGKSNRQINGKIATESAQGGFGMMQNIVNNVLDFEQIKMSLDNMRGAPDIMASANGNIMFNSTYTEIGLYLELYVCLETELLREAQRMNLYGFAYGMLDNVKNFDNIRKYFNYVSAIPNTIVYNDGTRIVGLPLPILNRLKAVFNKGVRFWNVAKTGRYLYYDKENYELDLEE